MALRELPFQVSELRTASGSSRLGQMRWDVSVASVTACEVDSLQGSVSV